MFWVGVAAYVSAERKGRLDPWAIQRTAEVHVTLLCILNSPLPYSYEAGILENPKVSPLPGSQLPVVVPDVHAI